MNKLKYLALVLLTFISTVGLTGNIHGQIPPPPDPDPEGIGMQGRLIQPPPATAPTIAIPANGTVFDDNPITVSGLCINDLLVRVFRNDAFAGAAICEGGSYSMLIDLFPGQNDLYARQYDDIDQVSPESNHRNVTFELDVPDAPLPPASVIPQLLLTSNFARRGANPGQELTWPLTISGGRGPYAVSIDWGDGDEDLFTVETPGNFDGKHVYENPGVFKVIIKANDADGRAAFLQLVAVANGPISPDAQAIGTAPAYTITRVLWLPAMISLPLLATSFWLGKRYQLKRVRYRMRHRIMPIDK